MSLRRRSTGGFFLRPTTQQRTLAGCRARIFVTFFINDEKVGGPEVVTMIKRPRCVYCRKAFTPPHKRGRPRLYCSASHRQRAYEVGRAAEVLPSLLLGRDIDDMRTKAGIERAVIDVLRRLGMLPSAPPKAPPLRLVNTEGEG
jgi:hypothetical protein